MYFSVCRVFRHTWFGANGALLAPVVWRAHAHAHGQPGTASHPRSALRNAYLLKLGHRACRPCLVALLLLAPLYLSLPLCLPPVVSPSLCSLRTLSVSSDSLSSPSRGGRMNSHAASHQPRSKMHACMRASRGAHAFHTNRAPRRRPSMHARMRAHGNGSKILKWMNLSPTYVTVVRSR